MKPIRLKMQAFGSYGERAEIDFTKPSQNLFLVAGDTGSGKTTIFDAVVFALYGEASSGSNKKDGKQMQSQFADSTVEPYVELTFSERNGGAEDIYTVRRVPVHVSAKKRGTGEKSVNESVSLTMPDGTAYPGKLRETNTKLEEIVTLTKAQFMQVAMIAQGEFMDILRAKTEDKKNTFRKLFHTELYQKIVDELNARQKEQKAEIAKIKTEFQTQVRNIIIPEGMEDAQALAERKQRVTALEQVSVVDMEALIDELDALCGRLQAQKEKAQEALKTAEKKKENAQEKAARAEELDKAFAALAEAEKTLKECAEQEGEIRRRKELLTRIQAAYAIQPVYRLFQNAKDQLEKNREELREQQQILPGLKEKYALAGEAEEKTRGEFNDENTRFGEISNEVEKAIEVLSKIVNAQENVTESRNVLQRKQEQSEQAKTAREAFEQQIQQWRKRADELSDTKVNLAKCESNLTECDGLEEDRKRCAELAKEVKKQERDLDNAQKEYEEARGVYRRKNDEYNRLRNLYLDAQAGFLAREKLKEGEPCPVCGSIHHPSPCVLAEEHKNLTREMIDGLAAEVSQLEQQQSAASIAAGSAKTLLEEKKIQLANAMADLCGRMKKSIPETSDDQTLEEAEERIRNLRTKLEQNQSRLKEAAAEQDALNEKLGTADQKLEKYRDAEKLASDAEKEADVARSAAEEKLKTLEQQKTYPTRQEAQRVLDDAKEKRDTKQNAHNDANRTLTAARTAKESAETKISTCENTIPGQEKTCEDRRTEYQQILTAKKLSEAEWNQIVRDHDETEIERLEKAIQSFHNRRSSAKGAKDAAEKTIAGQPKPDLEMLRQQAKDAKEAYDRQNEAFGKKNEAYNTDSRILKDLKPKMDERRKVVEEHDRLEDLYSRLSGRKSGAKMDLETYVQRYHLQRILHAANMRLREMSAGQYELRLVGAEEAGTGRSNTGLDLTVYSAVTGKERSVNTLSGGESFMAALSLALGMADQIQAASAAVNLDIMFIDEGFGSLDDHSRDEAVRVLKNMAGGSRLIGIISHVTELKQEIDDQLIVTKDDHGSHARWQLS